MHIINFLHHRVLAIYFKGIWMVLKQCVLVFSITCLNAQFVQRLLKVVFLQVVDNSSRDDSIGESKRVRYRSRTISDDMNVVVHQNVGENKQFR